MAELNLKQITDKLNSEFTGDVRKLVFWYDANAEFQEDIDSIEMRRFCTLNRIINSTSNTSWSAKIPPQTTLYMLPLQSLI